MAKMCLALVVSIMMILGVSCSKSQTSYDVHSGSTAEVSEPTLPPDGRSLFDHIFIKEGGYDGSKTLGEKPVEELVRLLDRFGKVHYTMVPFGRSLQKDSTDAAHPRILFMVDNEDEVGRYETTYRLYLGYAEKTGKLEAISYNEKAGRFEFQVASNFYPEGKPDLNYVERSVCTGCHQGGVPIFPQNDWRETTLTDSGGGDEATNDVVGSLMASSYLGLSVTGVTTDMGPVRAIHSSQAFDLAHPESANLAVLNESWRSCRERSDPESCRLALAAEATGVSGAPFKGDRPEVPVSTITDRPYPGGLTELEDQDDPTTERGTKPLFLNEIFGEEMLPKQEAFFDFELQEVRDDEVDFLLNVSGSLSDPFSAELRVTCTRKNPQLRCRNKNDNAWEVDIPVAYKMKNVSEGSISGPAGEWKTGCYYHPQRKAFTVKGRISCSARALALVRIFREKDFANRESFNSHALLSAVREYRGAAPLEPLNDFTPAPKVFEGKVGSVNEVSAENEGLKMLFRYCGECHGPQGFFSGERAFLAGETETEILDAVSQMGDEIKDRISREKGEPRAMPRPSENYDDFHSDENGLTKQEKVKFIIEKLGL